MPPAPPIDAVYTWVDGARPDYLAVVRRHAVRPQDINPERYRDAFDSLRYSLRSLEQFAPWLRHVYLFTCRPQVPAWLRRDHPRLRVVHHDEVITEPGVLPTFNSNVIECFLDRLPGISDRFVYLNDDHLLGAPVAREDFFAPDGRIRVAGTVAGERFRHRAYEHQWISLGLLEHGPLLIERRGWREMQALRPDEMREVLQHRFRGPDDLRPDRLYRWYMLSRARERAVAEPSWRYLRYAVFHKVRTNPATERRALARLAARRPRFICLNDDQGEMPNPTVVSLVRDYLEALCPTPSSFEQRPA